MTNQEINERVAKLCGWTIKTNTGLFFDSGDKPHVDLPNYAESLDACRSFEESVAGDDVGLYEYWLGEITQSDAMALRRCFVGERMKLIRATPLQRCEAFLRLKGQWE